MRTHTHPHVHAYVQGHTCVSEYHLPCRFACPWKHTWIPKVDIWYLSSVTLCPWTWSSLLARRGNQKIPGIQLPPLLCHWVKHMGHHAQLLCGHWGSKIRSSCLHRNTEKSIIHGMHIKRVIILIITMIIKILIQVRTVPLPHTRRLSYLFYIYYATQNTFNLTTVWSILGKPQGQNTCL